MNTTNAKTAAELATNLSWTLETARNRNRIDITGSLDGVECVTVTYIKNKCGKLTYGVSIGNDLDGLDWTKWDQFANALCRAALTWASDRKRPSQRLKTLGVDIAFELECLAT